MASTTTYRPARLLARRDRAGKGVVQQDPAQAGAAQLPGQGEAGEQDCGDLPWIAAAEALGKVRVLDQVRCEAVVGGYPSLRCRPDVGHAGPLGLRGRRTLVQPPVKRLVAAGEAGHVMGGLQPLRPEARAGHAVRSTTDGARSAALRSDSLATGGALSASTRRAK